MFRASNRISLILLALMVMAILSSALFNYFANQAAAEIRDLRSKEASIKTVVQRVQFLIQDTMEYSRRNPAIDPLLVQIGAKPPPARPATRGKEKP